MSRFLSAKLLTLINKKHGYLIGVFLAFFANGAAATPEGHITMKHIIFQLNGEMVEITLDENEATRDLLTLLPHQLEWDDYGQVEKISYLPRKISTQGMPDGYTPEKGDFAYYAPWGNIVIFCKPFSYSPGLKKLGHVSHGFEAACQKGKYTVSMSSR